MAIARAAGIELDYERSGSGPPLLLIMGMSGTMLHWSEPFLSALREDFEVIAYDHRGVGASSPLRGPVTIAQMATDATSLLDALEIDSAHVLGISMGGMIAQELALAHPRRVRTLALGCTYCGGEGSTPTSPEVLARIGAALSSGNAMLSLRTAFAVNFSAGAAADPAMLRAFLEVAARRSVAVPVIMAQLRACAAHETRTRLGALRMPTLVLHGTEDQMLPPANGRQIAALIPGARLELLEGAGHLFFWERPERSAELLRENASVPA